MSRIKTSLAQDERTLRYTGGVKPTGAVGITAGVETASTVPGQAAILSAVNILARSHPEIVFAVPDVPLTVASPRGGTRLVQASYFLAQDANPATGFIVADSIPDETASLGIGKDAGRASIYAGGFRWTARTGEGPLAVTDQPASVLGACLAVNLATGALFRQALGWPAKPDRNFSLWSLTETEDPSGPSELDPVDIGTTWLVGGGAVGSCLAWYLSFVGATGIWQVIDGDKVDVTNLNRSIGLFAPQAGLTGSPAVMKAQAIAELIPGARANPLWWDEWVATDPLPPDVLIPTANDRGVRPAVAAYGHPATIHATTSPHWTAELHRHLPGDDGCIACRLPEDAPAFMCATGSGKSESHGPSGDAALPFLSAAAGLLLLAGLLQIQHGHWFEHSCNHWRVFFDESVTTVQRSRWGCNASCSSVPAANVRQALHGETRWNEGSSRR